MGNGFQVQEDVDTPNGADKTKLKRTNRFGKWTQDKWITREITRDKY